MSTEAQRRASAKYQKANMKQVNVKFSPLEKDLYEYLKSRDSTAGGYIKSLLRRDMEENAK